MEIDAWRGLCHFILSPIGALILKSKTSWADTTAEFVIYRNAYVSGRDPIPASPIPLDTSSVATQLDFQSVTPKAALSGSAFIAADGTIARLAGIQGSLSTETLEYADFLATCFMDPLAAMTLTISDMQQIAGNALPCHELGRTSGRPTVSYAKCFFVDADTARSLSEVLIRKGVAFALRDSVGKPFSLEYRQVEDVARGTKACIWAGTSFLHPYGEHCRADQTMH